MPVSEEGRPGLLVVGGGAMGTALAGGLLRTGFDPHDLVVVEQRTERRHELSGLLPGVRIEAVPEEAEGAVVAVKPADAEPACRALGALGVPRVLSVMAGVPLARLAAWVGPGTALRAMPNVCGLIGEGVTALCGGSAEDRAWARQVLEPLGELVELPEDRFDAVTGLSGSGPAYVCLVVEALEEAGVLVGLPREVSRRLATRTVAGTGRLLLEGTADAAALRAQVTSPGGTTAAGLAALERRAARAAFLEAVAAATARAADLARGH
ncbi:pyrroline-5-carboxylate reductase [Aciditerrimonas ferrireducens]|uniref:Pyrroline-5-carboxylate reductase n=1 Tax=Aciditerrimonas ferrireducens TaxID=667306 RepID=A0ABV6C4L9_9ACTN